jgi:hypothetical protein
MAYEKKNKPTKGARFVFLCEAKEKETFKAQAEKEGVKFSELARKKLFGDK